MTFDTPDLLALILLLGGFVAAALYASILLREGANRRNGRIEILLGAGGLLMLALLARSLDRPEELLYCGTVGALLALLVANQWRWHLRTRNRAL